MAIIKLLEYTFDNTIEADCLPTFTGVGTTEVTDEVSGNITKRIINVEENGLPTSISFSFKTALLTLEYANTSNVTSMARMFQGCLSLISVNSCNWNTGKVTSMNRMFDSCKSLMSVNTSNWDTSKVADMQLMFYNCKLLTSIDTSNWNTSGVANFYSTFCDCSSLTSLDVSSWNTCVATNMSYMFSNCSSLTILDLSNINVKNVTNMYAMFNNCPSLQILDISNFDMGKVANSTNMFANCNKLQDIGLLYSPSSTVNTIASLLPTTTNKKIYYLDATPSDLTPVNNVNFVEYKSNTISSNEVILRSLPNGVCDTLDLMTGEYVQRVGEREYQVGDESNSQVSTDKINTQYELETPITTTIDLKQHPYAYKDGYVVLTSSSEEISLTPTIEYSLIANRLGQIQTNQKLVEKQQAQIDELESMVIANLVNTQYQQALNEIKLGVK